MRLRIRDNRVHYFGGSETFENMHLQIIQSIIFFKISIRWENAFSLQKLAILNYKLKKI